MAKIYPYKAQTGEINLWVFFCPGCKYDHPFTVRQYLADAENDIWEFNGDINKPTFSPSLLVFKSVPEKRCHSFVKDGKIEFLKDCFHELAGQTVELPEYEP